MLDVNDTTFSFVELLCGDCGHHLLCFLRLDEVNELRLTNTRVHGFFNSPSRQGETISRLDEFHADESCIWLDATWRRGVVRCSDCNTNSCSGGFKRTPSSAFRPDSSLSSIFDSIVPQSKFKKLNHATLYHCQALHDLSHGIQRQLFIKISFLSHEHSNMSPLTPQFCSDLTRFPLGEFCPPSSLRPPIQNAPPLSIRVFTINQIISRYFPSGIPRIQIFGPHRLCPHDDIPEELIDQFFRLSRYLLCNYNINHSELAPFARPEVPTLLDQSTEDFRDDNGTSNQPSTTRSTTSHSVSATPRNRHYTFKTTSGSWSLSLGQRRMASGITPSDLVQSIRLQTLDGEPEGSEESELQFLYRPNSLHNNAIDIRLSGHPPSCLTSDLIQRICQWKSMAEVAAELRNAEVDDGRAFLTMAFLHTMFNHGHFDRFENLILSNTMHRLKEAFTELITTPGLAFPNRQSVSLPSHALTPPTNNLDATSMSKPSHHHQSKSSSSDGQDDENDASLNNGSEDDDHDNREVHLFDLQAPLPVKSSSSQTVSPLSIWNDFLQEYDKPVSSKECHSSPLPSSNESLHNAKPRHPSPSQSSTSSTASLHQQNGQQHTQPPDHDSSSMSFVNDDDHNQSNSDVQMNGATHKSEPHFIEYIRARWRSFGTDNFLVDLIGPSCTISIRITDQSVGH